ncbi:MAG: UDP-N-acetylglucosamine--N-acetylmuramyl-(pentapeptide) pyrophosphoryl-undecaprenol N-acetylglucosamine transferase [Oceanicoccus sp.]
MIKTQLVKTLVRLQKKRSIKHKREGGIMTNSPRPVLIMAGGTGGHVFPALAAAASLRAKGIDVQWLGTRRGIEARLVPAANIDIHFISVSGLRGKGILSITKGLLQLFSALWQSLRVVMTMRPICVLGMGGFASGPGGVAAWLTGCPLVIHEQNAVPGTTNKILAKIARKVLLGYPVSLAAKKSRYIGNPVRGEIAELATPQQRGVGSAGELKLLVLGGSLGAKPINDVLPMAIALMVEDERPAVWHQTGQAHLQVVNDAYLQVKIEAKVEDFIDDMAAAYSWADIVLCRAGALTVAELAAVGAAAILVPLPHAIDDHQTANARWLSEQCAAVLLPQSQLSAASLAQLLERWSADRQGLLAMANTARSMAKTDAAEQVAACCMEVANV